MCHPFVSIIIPAYNEEEFIESCLISLLNQDYPSEFYEIIVVDNGSRDGTVEISRSYGVEVLILESGKVGAVRNEGTRHSKGSIFAFIDSDCVAGRSWISTAVQFLKDPEVGAVGGFYRLPRNASWVERSWVLGERSGTQATSSLAGGSFIVKKDVFLESGGFDEIINAGEDTKLSHQVSSSGYLVFFVEECAVTHLGYPKRIADFMKRQFWHASSYIKSNNGLKDKVFLGTIVFMSLYLCLIASFFIGSWVLAFTSIGSTIALSFLFTLNRIRKGGYDSIRWSSLPGALLLDYLYFLSRMCGMLASVFYDPFKRG